MRTTKAWDSLQESVGHLWTLLIDNLMAIGAFAIVGLAALVYISRWRNCSCGEYLRF
jgi:hypothetical protein